MEQNDLSLSRPSTLHYSFEIHPYVSELHYLCIVTAKLKNMATIDDVKNMIERNEVKNAIAQLDVMIELCPELDELYYLRGNAYRKFNSWKNALNDYCKAISLNPDSPAVEAYRASLEILEFFNKDMLNP